MLLEIASLDERLGGAGSGAPALHDGLAAAHLTGLAQQVLE
jgi:hypothetical protein